MRHWPLLDKTFTKSKILADLRSESIDSSCYINVINVDSFHLFSLWLIQPGEQNYFDIFFSCNCNLIWNKIFLLRYLGPNEHMISFIRLPPGGDIREYALRWKMCFY